MTVAGAQEKGIELTLELTAHNDAVLMDKLRLKQVLVNLIKNSMETATAPQNHKIRIKTSPAESDTVRVDVADTGAALPDQDKVSLFEPFLTAKEKSLGVGLAISRLIVETHYGKIWVEPNPEGGAVFVFTLPQAHPRLTIGAS
jgi:two-component system CheB/CheR fusion protein